MSVVLFVVFLLIGLLVVGPLLGETPLGDPLGLAHRANGTPVGQTYSQARAMADPYAAAQGGGAWDLYIVSGLSLTQAFQPGAWSCPSGLALVSNGGNLGTGTAPMWFFGYAKPNGSGGGAVHLDVLVEGSTVHTLPASCAGDTTFLGPLAPSGIMDSEVAASDALADGGSSYLRAHPNASANYLLADASTYQGFSRFWYVELGVCPVQALGPRGAYPDFAVSLNATTGAVLGWSNTTQSCPGANEPAIGALSYGVGGGGAAALSQPDYPTCNSGVGGDPACFTPNVDGSCSFTVNPHSGVALLISVQDRNGNPLSGVSIDLTSVGVSVYALPSSTEVTGSSPGGGPGDAIWTSLHGTVPANDPAGGDITVSASYSFGGTTTTGTAQLPVSPPTSANC
ncbi:MAG: hypothetical protein KGJ23_12265 [Euryarchaeota archaeon]|nr:hypothetical protein [Euryarchaeota archaeon]MDE1881822.1 hypothetical protein [Euryarchaeota archaeon]MDE2045649.1 hypothetical protein [Thermoplasmata archaeon]